MIMTIVSDFSTTARILIHVQNEDDLPTVANAILERFPNATQTEVRDNSRDPFEGGKHVLIYLKAVDLGVSE